MAIEKIPQPYSGRNGPDIEAEFLADMARGTVLLANSFSTSMRRCASPYAKGQTYEAEKRGCSLGRTAIIEALQALSKDHFLRCREIQSVRNSAARRWRKAV
ncbi:hypothetical protein ELH48_36405 (plasmid) [Rhizobium ruizarguesonis]|uniref:hypothetical protein n=1 Tax=Rhizobium ruizarguesonis TaxID=2081791 RepID=UPI0010300126|nr:hypothetical protein [Rhizobium ruizarguesonis]TBB15036.1 hypothetical protein ELH48_36405 [Rhizobium ruizarguesonis]